MPSGRTLQVIKNNIPRDKNSRTKGPGHIFLEICDTGTGMDQQTEQRIFEPLYSSKQEGRGTGLTLSVIANIIEQHQGNISVTSALGVCTSFQVAIRAISPQRTPSPFISEHSEVLSNYPYC
jgi:signal transduction histidine kinase